MKNERVTKIEEMKFMLNTLDEYFGNAKMLVQAVVNIK